MASDSTKKIYLNGLVASLVSLFVVSANALLVIRLSLTYLGKEEFGLLSLLAQVSAFISILDLGLYVAFSRILIDYTSGTKVRYANALKTATWVFQFLGIAGLLCAVIVAFFGASALSIPGHLKFQFTVLMLAQGLVLWATFSMKSVSAPLVANGKHHFIYWLNSILTILNALVFWLALRGGVGIYSSFLALSVQLILNAIIIWRLSKPHRETHGFRGSFDTSIFWEVMAFARDSLLWLIGGQALASLPIMLASAWFALSSAADLSAGMKLILLLVSVCTRFADMSVTPLSIEFAKGNQSAAGRKMQRVAGLSGGVGVCAALGIVCINPGFIGWWMLEKVSWSWHANLAGALWVAILAVTQCLYGYAVISRQMGLIRWALLSECALYLGFTVLLQEWAGPDCLLWAKPAAALLIGASIAWRIRKHSSFDTMLLLQGILRQSLVLAVMLGPCLYFSMRATSWSCPPFITFIVNCMGACAAVALALPFLFPRDLRDELLAMARNGLSKLIIHLRPPTKGQN